MVEIESGPSRDPRQARLIARAWSGYDLAIILGAIALLHVFTTFAALLYPREQLPLYSALANLLIYGTVSGMIILILRRRGMNWGSAYGMGPGQFAMLGYSLLLYVIMLPLLMLSTSAWHFLLRQVAETGTEVQQTVEIIMAAPPVLRTLYILMAVVIAPLYEEVVFRGTLYPYLLKHGGELKSMFIVSVLFAALHYHVPSFVPLVVLSAVLCVAYKRTGSLWICIGAHALFNAVSIIVLFSS